MTSRRAYSDRTIAGSSAPGLPSSILLGLAFAITLLIAAYPVLAQNEVQATAPSNLTAQIVDGGVALSWDAPSDDADTVDGYEILRRRPGVDAVGIFHSIVSDTESTDTAYTDMATQAGTSYTYRVKALRGDSKSGASNFVRVDLPANALTGFTLVDAADQTVLASLADGDLLGLDDPANGSFGIRAEVDSSAQVESVRLELSGPKTRTQTENVAPYSLYGDDGSDLHGEDLPVGSYTLKATAYSLDGLQGNELATLQISFTVSSLAVVEERTSLPQQVDTTAPSFLSTDTNTGVDTSGAQIDLAFDEVLDETNLPLTGSFTVTADGSDIPVSGLSVFDNQILALSLGLPIGADQAVLVSYTDPTAGDDTAAIQDAAGNDAASFSLVSIENSSDLPPLPQVLRAEPEVDLSTHVSNTVTLSWTIELDVGEMLTRYDYRYSTDRGENWGDWTAIPSSASLITYDVPLTFTYGPDGAHYTFQLRAVDSDGNGPAAEAEFDTTIKVERRGYNYAAVGIWGYSTGSIYLRFKPTDESFWIVTREIGAVGGGITILLNGLTRGVRYDLQASQDTSFSDVKSTTFTHEWDTIVRSVSAIAVSPTKALVEVTVEPSGSVQSVQLYWARPSLLPLVDPINWEQAPLNIPAGQSSGRVLIEVLGTSIEYVLDVFDVHFWEWFNSRPRARFTTLASQPELDNIRITEVFLDGATVEVDAVNLAPPEPGDGVDTVHFRYRVQGGDSWTELSSVTPVNRSGRFIASIDISGLAAGHDAVDDHDDRGRNHRVQQRPQRLLWFQQPRQQIIDRTRGNTHRRFRVVRHRLVHGGGGGTTFTVRCLFQEILNQGWAHSWDRSELCLSATGGPARALWNDFVLHVGNVEFSSRGANEANSQATIFRPGTRPELSRDWGWYGVWEGDADLLDDRQPPLVAGSTVTVKLVTADRPSTRPATNVAPTGAPSIRGKLDTGHRQTADGVGIADADGMTNSTVSYQWISVDGSGNEENKTAGATHIPKTADLGKRLKVRATFTDDEGMIESVTSAVTDDAVVRDGTTRELLWLATLSLGQSAPQVMGFISSDGELAPSKFTFDESTTYTISRFEWDASAGKLYLDVHPAPGAEQIDSWVVSAAGAEFGLNDSSRVVATALTDPAGTCFEIDASPDDAGLRAWTVGQDVTVALKARNNLDPEGQVGVRGIRLRGETLTANPLITDPNGNGALIYQWIRVGTDSTETPVGTDSPTYMLGAEDVGSSIKVRVSYTDGDGFMEPTRYNALVRLTSEEVGPVREPFLVSNTEQTSSSQVSLNASYPSRAQGFTTGPNGGGYALSAIGIELISFGPFGGSAPPPASELTVTVNPVDSGVPSASALCTLINPATLSAAVNIFAAPTTDPCPILTKSTTYFVVVERTGSTAINMWITDSDDEDDYGDDSWSIVNVGGQFGATSQTWSTTQALQIEVRGMAESSVTVSESELTIGEGGSDRYTIVLDDQPSANVTIDITVGGDVTTNVSSVTFTTQNWSNPREVTVSAAHDLDGVHDNEVITHTVTADSAEEYVGASIDDVDVTVTDDEAPGVRLNRTSLTVPEGGSRTYTVVLNTQPTGNVTIDITDGGDVTTNVSSMTFTPQNWNNPKVVTVSAAHDPDGLDDHEEITHMVTADSAGEYVGASIDDVDVTVDDDEEIGVTFSPTSLIVDEGDSTTYTIVLDAQPTGPVRFDIAVSGDLNVTPDFVTFTSTNWDMPQMITVTAPQDENSDNERVEVVHSIAAGSAAEYLEALVNNEPILRGRVDDDDAPPPTITTGASTPVRAPFRVTITFYEDVTAPEEGEITGWYSGTPYSFDLTDIREEEAGRVYSARVDKILDGKLYIIYDTSILAVTVDAPYYGSEPGGQGIWSATMTVEDSAAEARQNNPATISGFLGYGRGETDDGLGEIDDATFTFQGTEYTVVELIFTPAWGTVELLLSEPLPNDGSGRTLHLGNGQWLRFQDHNYVEMTADGSRYRWGPLMLDWKDGDSVTVAIK